MMLGISELLEKCFLFFFLSLSFVPKELGQSLWVGNEMGGRRPGRAGANGVLLGA